MFVIAIDPHRGPHATAVLDGDERVRAVLQLPADRQRRQRLLSWATEFAPRLRAVEGATGTGALLAQQLVAAGEQVLDVPPKLAAGCGCRTRAGPTRLASESVSACKGT
jgi:transposase